MPEPTTESSASSYPLAPWAIWFMCIVFTPFCGVVLYVAWKDKNDAAARLSMRAMWVSAFLWLAWALFGVAMRHRAGM
jgi:Na+/proline symporter